MNNRGGYKLEGQALVQSEGLSAWVSCAEEITKGRKKQDEGRERKANPGISQMLVTRASTTVSPMCTAARCVHGSHGNTGSWNQEEEASKSFLTKVSNLPFQGVGSSVTSGGDWDNLAFLVGPMHSRTLLGG